MNLTQYIEECTELLLAQTAVSTREAERRAGQFLHVQVYIVKEIETLTEQKLTLEALKALTYAQLYNADTSKTQGARETNVNGHPEYADVVLRTGKIVKSMDALKSYYRTFENAHILYRQLSKGEM